MPLRSSFRGWCAAAAFSLIAAAPLLAQDPCDSVMIHSVQYASFSDTALQVVAENTSQQFFFSYPQFMLVDTQGDTLAREPMNFFGLGVGQQSHILPFEAGGSAPATPFTGDLVLRYVTVGGTGWCVFPLDEVVLCPQPPCVPMDIFLYSFGSFMTYTATFDWSVTDSLGATVGSGVMAIDSAGAQQDYEQLCLPPGRYALHVSQDEQVGWQFMVGMTQGDNILNSGPSGSMLAGGSIDLPVTWYPSCIGIGTGIADASPQDPLLAWEGGRLRVTAPGDGPLGPLAVYDASGRCLLQASANTTSTVLDLGRCATGVHILRPLDPRATWTAQRFLIP